MAPDAPVLVTGGSGYLGTHVVAALLRTGHSVRATVRASTDQDAVREAVRRGGADDAALEFAIAELLSDDGWNEAMEGVTFVQHTASPMIQPADPDDVVRPALEGTLQVLRAARQAEVRRVVLTSSFAAVGYNPKDPPDYTEADWTDPDRPGLPAYPRSKTLAERAAWDFMDADGGDMELVVLNPTFILGPPLVKQARSSLMYIKMMLDGKMAKAPRQYFGLVDVRDLADLHVGAMDSPGAAGQRFLALADGPSLSWLDIATVLRTELGSLGERAPTEEMDAPDPPRVVIHNDKAKAELGFAPRPAQTTILETARSLEAFGLLES